MKRARVGCLFESKREDCRQLLSGLARTDPFDYKAGIWIPINEATTYWFACDAYICLLFRTFAMLAGTHCFDAHPGRDMSEPLDTASR